KSARLKGWDYGADAYYFVTICTHEREHFFGRVMRDNGGDASVALSGVGVVARDCWNKIPNHFENVILDEYMVMPNHFHGIIQICKYPVDDGHAKSVDIRYGGRRDVACNVSTVARTMGIDIKHTSHNERKKWMSKISPKSGSLPTIIRSFKSAVTKQCNDFEYDFKWQTRFYDRIIRNEETLGKIHEYIKNNPNMWHRDKNNPEGIFM
ncbi:transposase, partial [Patescibacteria group bacterium]|nr:transposase [Patescibacteria group bacterium]